MIEHNNISLKKYNTLHINAIAKKFFIPENELELVSLLEKLNKKNEKYNILSGGSNVLVNDNSEYDNIIHMIKVDKSKQNLNDGKFYIGASNRIQEVIRYVNNAGYGGFEELYCLPALFGGIIYMNAGIGGKEKTLLNISEFIYRVKVLNVNTRIIEWFSREQCQFEHRKSIFHNNEYIILGAEIVLKNQDKKSSEARIQKRIEYCKKNQEWEQGCFGTCFSIASYRVLKLAKMIMRKSGQIHFGKNNCNWLVNHGNGTYKDAIKLINLCFFLHKITFRKIELEVKILK